MRRTSVAALCLLLACSLNLAASDVARERRWSDQVIDGLVVGEATWLQTNGQEFLAIYTESTAETQGGVILLHGIGVHPDWPDVIHPLRLGLPDHGWSTLSLQMPIADRNATFDEYIPLLEEAGPRIEAGIKFLEQQGVFNIVLLGHSLGAMMGLKYLAQEKRPKVSAFAAVGLNVSRQGLEPDILGWLRTTDKPMLDLYGARDLDGVRNTAELRARAAQQAENRDYLQVEIPVADHFFRGADAALVKRVRGWLKTTAPGDRVEAPVRP